MRLLLDTHIFLWYIVGDARLSVDWRNLLRQPENEVFVSVISIWEASVKYRLGKLPLPDKPEVYLPVQRTRHQLASLPLEENAVRHLAALPEAHRDPFDRMLVCQALQNRLTLVTVDPVFSSYPVPLLD